MARVCFHTDDSYSATGEKHFSFVTAGIALDGIKSEMKYLLTKVEERTDKGAKDWHSTKDPIIRVRYIEEVLDMSQLVGRIFYGGGTLLPDQFWKARVDILSAAVERYSQGGTCRHEMATEGLTGRPRQQLERDLRNRGLRRVTVEAASIANDPETRCADALAGYIRAKLFEDSQRSQDLPSLPDWLVDLLPLQKENPPVV
jgi:hypothetical protein